jgi:Flp pilus assembly protein TadG
MGNMLEYSYSLAVRACLRAWKRAHSTDAQEIAEAALILPALFMLLLGIMWFSRALNVYATVNRAAREAALAAAAPSCATCGNAFASAASIQSNVVNPILQSDHLDSGNVQSFTVTRSLTLPNNPTDNPQEALYTVNLSYLYGLKLNGVTCCPLGLTTLTNGITIATQAQARQEQ